MDRKTRAAAIDERLAKLYPRAHIMLTYESEFQLLVAVILSAQTTDVTVNSVTPALFEEYPDAAALASADPDDVERLVHRTGFFRNKTKNIIGAARMIVAEYGGEALHVCLGCFRVAARLVDGRRHHAKRHADLVEQLPAPRRRRGEIDETPFHSSD